MKLCCLVSPVHWCYQCSRQFCMDCRDAFLTYGSPGGHDHMESGKWDFYQFKK